ncbi:MAG: ABC transporter permease [Rhodobacteraceae bacterium]|jgi:peptide/nickel transport system permease protein|nr:ABC transporter permease [Paracoccaceae bacterium]
MARIVLNRLGQFAFILLIASFLLFAVTEFSPGNVASKILGPYALESQVRSLSDRLGLDDPLFTRYLRWLGMLVGLVPNELGGPATGLGLSDPRGAQYFGNFGFSLMQGRPIVDVLADRFGHTVTLTVWAIGLTVPISLVLGVLAGMTEGSALDRIISVTTVSLTSLPEFVVAVLLIFVFAASLGWLPGTSPLDPGDRWSVGSQLVLPVAVLVIASSAYVTRIVRSSVVDTLAQPFVRTARLKGLAPMRVAMLHVLRNAMIAPVTVILLQINWILTGVVVVEAIFAYPGIGRLMLEAALFGDIYLIQALTLIALSVAVTTQFLGDLAYVLLDPRIRVA